MKGLYCRRFKQRGFALITAMFFVMIFSAISVGLFSMSSMSIQTSANLHDANHAFNAALSGLECARYILTDVETFETGVNTVSDEEADTMWSNLCTSLQNKKLGGKCVGNAHGFCYANRNGQEIKTGSIPYGNCAAEFQVRFFRYDSDPRTIFVESCGSEGEINRTVQMEISITKDAEVLNYALAGRGRMWLTGDTTIHGDVYSSWDREDIAPFNATSETVVEGSFNTVIGWQDMLDESYEMQSYAHNSNGYLLLDDGKTVDGSGRLRTEDGDVIRNAAGTVLNINTMDFENIDSEYNLAKDGSGHAIAGYVYDGNGALIPIGTLTYGNPVEAYYSSGDRVVNSSDELQGEYETMNYSQPAQDDIPGLSIDDYDTSMYQNYVLNEGNGDIPTSSTKTTEYFPHASGDYSSASSSSSRKLTRHVYENMTFSNVRLPSNRNALFKNCTFEDILYVDCSASTSSYYNNVRFEDCTFNGVIVTDTPSTVKWQYNALYFTGTATFNNQSDIQEATILAPHFNVDLGNTNPEKSDNNVITGAIVGGIVDVRGNAQIYGTIISMFDTTNYSSGFVTNIGATLEDGGSETTDLGDIGTIEITPDKNQLLPSGITSPVILKLDTSSYSEI